MSRYALSHGAKLVPPFDRMTVAKAFVPGSVALENGPHCSGHEPGMNCHRPLAPTGDVAYGSRPDSPMATATHTVAYFLGPPAPTQYSATWRAVSVISRLPGARAASRIPPAAGQC